jgi:hypothetical protein
LIVVLATGAYNAYKTLVIPPGAVVAFNAPKCPTDWQDFTAAHARFIVGAGAPDNPDQNKGLRTKSVNDRGGFESVKIAVDDLPTLFILSQTIHLPKGGETITGAGVVLDPKRPGDNVYVQQEQPAKVALDILPPYLAMTYCVK